MPNLKVREYMVFSTMDRKLKKVRAVFSSSFTSNYRYTSDFDMQYLRNAQSDFDPVFFYLFVFSSSVTYVKTEKMVLTPPPPLALIWTGQFNVRFYNILYLSHYFQ